MSSARFKLLVIPGAILVLLLSALSSFGQAQPPPRRVNDPTHPLSRDPRNPNIYDLETARRNSRIREEVEIALKEAGEAFNTKPPRYADAEQAYFRATKLEPKEARAYLGLALVYAAQNQADQTVTALKKAIEIKPKYAEAHFNLGMVLLATGKKNEAIEEYKTLETLDKQLAKKLKELIGK